MIVRLVFILFLFPNCFYAENCSAINIDTAMKTMEQLLDYHVEYKKLTPPLTTRTIKLFIEQFDAEKSYLLQNEFQKFVGIEVAQTTIITESLKKKDFAFFQKISLTLNEAILRARQIRAEIYREYVLKKDLHPKDIGESFASYPADESLLEERLRRKILRFLFAEAKLSHIDNLTPATKEKIFNLLEKKLQRFEEGYSYFQADGKRVNTEEKEKALATHFLKAFAKSLDAHTAYFTFEEAQDMRYCLEKQFEGIGVVLREGVYGIEIAELVPGSPAEKSHSIEEGDLIIAIDGRQASQMGYSDVLKAMKGEPGSKIVLQVQKKDGSQIRSVTLRREKILIQDDRIVWSYEPYGDGIIGKIVLSSFYESSDGSSCENDLRKAIKELKSKGNLNGLILDLRNNSGGFLTQAVKVAGLFIKTGVVVISKYSQGKTSYLRDLDGRIYYDGPLIVLTSKASASAAEIVAQALQDYGTAIIAGDERTYGKGTIQYQNVTDKNADTFYKVTVGKYYTVSGKTTQIEGVKADIVVPTAYYSLNIGERYLEYSLAADNINSLYVDPLHDIDESRKAWFQKNYLPNLQIKDQRWQTYMSHLTQNSQIRVSKNKNYQNFLQFYDRQKKRSSTTSSQISMIGKEDLPLTEASEILKDMVYLKHSEKL